MLPGKPYVRGNQAPCINFLKNFSKSVILRRKLRNIFLKERTKRAGENITSKKLCA